MTEEKNKSGPSGTHSLVETFHQVRSLVPDDQELVSVKPNTRVAEALKLMKKHHYSQLPVVVGKAVLGVFSYRSFSEKALTRQKTNKAEWLGDLPVEDFLEEYEFVHGSHDWNRILGYLNQDDAFFVGHRDGQEGLVTAIDVLDFYRQIATPFIVLAEIELSLRKVIQTSIPPEHRTKALEGSLTTAYEGRDVPMDLNEMTFDNYVQIISNNGNWRYFEAMFDPGDVSRKLTVRKLQQLREWRNIVFHFKRELEPWEMDILSEHREWLQRRVRAYEAQLAESLMVVTKGTRRSATIPHPMTDSKREYLPRMDKLFEWGILKSGDNLSIKNKEGSTATVIDENNVFFDGRKMRYNDWGKAVTGNKAIRIYTEAIHDRLGKTLDELRSEKIAEIEVGKQ